MLRGIERQLGVSAVHRWTGGAGGGGAELTKEGKLLIDNYRHMTAEIEKYTETTFDKYFGGDWLNRE